MQYRADIDGLRAIAVIPVILFHAQIPLFSGGFVGVDVFFVISGYLITGLILAEARNNQYTIWGFYRRRIRRILPALFAVLISSSILAWQILLPEDFRDYANSLIATISFASNIFFMRHLDYFAIGAEFAPLLHTWSLAIEEQFYIVYPVALWLIFRYLKHRLVHFLTITLLLSFGFSVWLTPANPTASFYLLPSRAWELLLGAIVAMGTLPRLKSTWRELAAIAGLGMIVWSIFSFSALTSFPGLPALVPCLGCALLLYAGHSYAGKSGETVVGRILQIKAIVGVGLISYSLYLWHWPMLAIARHYYASAHLPTNVTAYILCSAVLLSVLSWRFVERPFRNFRQVSTRRIISLSLTSATALLIFGFLVSFGSGIPGRFSESVLEIAAVKSDRDTYAQNCLTSGQCLIGSRDIPVVSFILWGDSHAAAIYPAISKAAEEKVRAGLFFGKGACPPLVGVTRAYVGENFRCIEFNEHVLEAIRSNTSVETVILAARWALNGEGYRYKEEPGSPVYLASERFKQTNIKNNRAIFLHGLERTLSRIKELNKRIVLVGSIPEIGIDVPWVMALNQSRGVKSRLAPTKDEFSTRQQFVLDSLSSFADAYNAKLILPHEALCDENVCNVENDGVPLYVDDDHISKSTATRISYLFDSIF